MASLAPPVAPLDASEKHQDTGVVFLERQQTNADSEMGKPVPKVERIDYSGAHEKTDPKEIALVKKLDRWIMPMLWSMYWLNYLDRNAIALARINYLEEDLNLTSTRESLHAVSYVHKYVKLTRHYHRVPDMCQHLVRRVLAWRHSKQHVFDQVCARLSGLRLH